MSWPEAAVKIAGIIAAAFVAVTFIQHVLGSD